MLEFTQGDMFEAPADIRVNTVNCVGVMGAGVALAFKQRYPEMFKDYQYACKDGRVRPGRMHVWKSLEGDWIVNFPTKRDWRDPSRYEDIDAGLDDLRTYLDSVGPVTVALPALGCGHGGLDWDRVSVMIQNKLSDVDARVLVFAPSASRQAGRSAIEVPTDDELASTEKLGYRLVEPGAVPALQLHSPVYLIGEERSLSRKWIALLPSRTPGEREIQALHAVAAELARSESAATVALVHGAKVSEEIAQVFVDQGINTLLLLPFGVLTRKAIARRPAIDPKRSPALASAAPANAKWSRQLFAQAQNLLCANAAAVLLSDPEPDWLTAKGLGKWAQTPISYIRYETTPVHMGEALVSVGAHRISRRRKDGAPDIDYLVSALDADRLGQPDSVNTCETDSETNIVDQASTTRVSEGAGGAANVVTIEWDKLPQAARRKWLELLREWDAADVIVSLKLPTSLSKIDRERLAHLLPAEVER
ncbi:macro domain-containing protein [Xanthomonas bonasiae]|uniref:macro domain-containing protein n=1 Tax=Xanthomonas bonasiae TaxID=2810351 RepID=UPI001981830B|nr:macro domain-containing protein [Xanthomonas bonasiae]MBN6110188.1 macro domain-containing protein [Xanthomonas bonasiae]